MRSEEAQGPATEGGSSAASQAANPSIRLPKGGGAVRGIGEKFAANPVTGTGSMSVPIATSPGRSGFGPQLSLSYDSGSGNGPFGFGWSLSLPSITRKTDKGLPQYLDAQESDVFVLSGAEDLVPVHIQDAQGTWARERLPVRTVDGVFYRIDRYRPRIEGLFTRIERWTNTTDTSDVFWRSISKDNVTTWYGCTPESRIADPDPSKPSHIFSWLICESHDDKGNVIAYGYKAEDSARVFEDVSGNSLTKAHERNRTDQSRSAQRYLKRIRYGNHSPYLPALRDDAPWPEPADAEAPDGSNAWHFEAVLDYGEHDANAPTPTDAGTWPSRPDPLSSFRAGFEVRTYRICRRVLMFHHFAGEAGVGRNCLVRSTDFTHSDQLLPADPRNPVYAFLKAVTQTGYRRNNPGYNRRSLPPVEFEYSEPQVQEVVDEVASPSLENLPAGLDGSAYRWTDLYGEGIPGILSEQAGAWHYKRNLGPLTNTAQFAPIETVALKPNVALGAGAEIMDLAGDGQPDVVVMEGPTPGLYVQDDAEGWQLFRSFTSRLNRDLRDPNLKFVDLDGDGHADVLITENDAFVWHASLAEEGFGQARRVVQTLDEERGPRIVFADGEQAIYLADLSGDGLTDIVRIRNGNVCYWPNLGYGRFGAKVTMDDAPWFDHPDQFDQKRIRLADIDGSGTTDIIYLHRGGVCLYFNQSGNGWSQPHRLQVFPRVDDLVSIVPTDLLGNGTACLVWSSPLPGDARRPMRYVNLMGGQKPHLLIKTINNLGAETQVDYAPSTKFYLQDRRDGKPWITRLPFPVHVVERVQTYDHISRNRFVTRYAYHHGHFDGEEREFRGFGMVEQWDTEQFAALADGNAPADNIAAATHVPPVHTKTWFHTGIYLGRERIYDHFAGLLNATDPGEYFREPGLTDAEARALLVPDTVLPDGLTLEEEREACRALKGSMLRQELYADDADDAAASASPAQIQRALTPYTVTEQNFSIRPVQPRCDNRHAVFFTHAREAVSHHYERNPADPRIQHAMTLEVDGLGNVLKQAAIGYGRRAQIRVADQQGNVQQIANPGLTLLQPTDQAKQTTPLLTYTENRVTNAVESADEYRLPLPSEAVTFELTGYVPTGPGGRYQAADFVEPDPAAAGRLSHKFTRPEVAYEATAAGGQRRRPIEWLRTLYQRDDLGGLLPLDQLQSLGLPGESYKLAFTPGLLNQVFQRPRPGQAAEALLPNPSAVLGGQAGNRGGYLQSQALKADGRFRASDANDHWWIPSGRSFFTANPTDSTATELAAARQHFFLPRRYRDPFGQNAFVELDAHDLLMTETRDALGNRVTAEINDYRVLQPRLVSDPNRNRIEVAFDALGMVVATAVMGKPAPAPAEGDSLAGFVADLSQGQIDAFLAGPVQAATDPRRTQASAITRGLLAGATTRIVYDLDRYRRLGQPAMAATIAREIHVSELDPAAGQESPLQVSFSHSDGFGREIQKKIQAEPGRLDTDDPQSPLLNPRWVGSGWTIFNNKGKPVRQYEPFFSATHGFEFNAIHGVSPVLFYDPTGRVIATLHPNHTFEKVVFDPWQQTTFDVSDTCAARNQQTGDPRTDPDIGGYVSEYFKGLQAQPAQPWLTWHAQRIGSALGTHERNAAQRAAAHADTPTTAHFDALGRPFLTVARNRVVCASHDLDGTEESFATRVELDIEGNQRAVLDERRLPVNHLPTGSIEQRIVMRYAHDMLGNRIHQLSMEAGARWMLNDVVGKPIRAWDSRGHNFTTSYDALRRSLEQTVRGTVANGEGASDPRTLNRDTLADKIEYGESLANAETLNLRTLVYRHFDSAGIATSARLDANGDPTEAYDFKGNLRRSTRQLVTDYKTIPDWQQSPLLDAEAFEASTRYDALNRPVQSIAPHSSVTRAQHPNKINVLQPVFNEANLLDRVDVWLELAAEPTALLDSSNVIPSPVGVANIDHDAKGQRKRIDYKNGASTLYSYDTLTFRLTQLQTKRKAADFPGDDPLPPVVGWPGKQVQNLHYTYDPAGNITHIHDVAQQAVYFRNRFVEPSNDYTYDALYRLIQASGREHLGQAGGAPMPHSHDDSGRVGLPHPGDGNAMDTYTERYVYDAVGNFLQMQHRGSNPAHSGWTRRYTYGETSLIEAGKQSNRLSSTQVGNGATSVPEPYQHDAHGNMLRMPHLGGGAAGPNMHWDHKDQLRQTDLGGGGTAFYVYDASGQRVRKVWEKSPSLIEERIYLGGFEIFRRHSGPIGANTATLERETLHVMDDQQRIALVETRTLPRTSDPGDPLQLIRYQFGNHLGSASLELDEKAQIISYEEYSPYGSSTYQAVRSQTEAAKRYRHTGKESDEESGLYYHGARYCLSWLGRWCAPDPAGLIDGMNLYSAMKANPTRFIDMDGFSSNDPNLERGLKVRKELIASQENLERSMSKEEIRPAYERSDEAARNFKKSENELSLKRQFELENDPDALSQKQRTNRIAENVDSILLDADKTEIDLNALIERETDKLESKELIQQSSREIMTPEELTNAFPDASKKSTGFQRLKDGVRRFFTASANSLEVGGNLLGSATGGYQIGTGISEIVEGKTASGAVNVSEGSSNLALTIGTEVAIKSGTIAVEAGAAAGALAAGATVAAGAAVALAAEESRRSLNGEKTQAAIAVDYYADLVEEGVERGGIHGFFIQSAGYTGGSLAAIIAAGQGYRGR